MEECSLFYTLEEIKNKKKREWEQIVEEATWNLNKKKILDLCMCKGKVRTKTKEITRIIENGTYQRGYNHNALFELPRHSVKTILMARYGMLDCAANYHGRYRTKLCEECGVTDNEDHRINSCRKWENVNLYGTEYNINFDIVFSNNIDELRQMSGCLNCIWNLENGRNEMKS